MTKQRMVISDYLKSQKTHPTAEEIFMSVKKHLPSIAQGTVYRNLALMEECGEARRITIPNSPDRFDGDMSEHSHILCVKCKRVYDICSDVDVTLPDDMPDGISILGVDVVVKCVCSECRKIVQN